MSKNINQIFVANPAAAMAATDLLYLGRSPFGAANDMAITWSNMMASITTVGTITSGTWNGTVIAMQYGGSGKNLTANNGGIVWTDADSMEVLAGTATAGRMLQSGATATPSWSTPTYPSASGAAGQVIRSDGTNNLYSTFTIPDTAAINTIPYASSANVYDAITPVNSALLISSGAGVPSWSNTAIPGFIMAGGIDMNSQTLTNVPTPSANGDAANKQYVDTTALNGTSVYAATAAGLTVTQAGAGPGATLTNAGAMAAFSIDGVSPPVGVNVLVKDIAAGGTAANYGIYTVTTVGSGAANWVLTRATSYDTATEINNTGVIVVQNGSTLAGTGWYNSATITTVDTTNFSFSQFGLTVPVTVAQGGTGDTSLTAYAPLFGGTTSTNPVQSGTVGTAGQVLTSNGAGALPTFQTPSTAASTAFAATLSAAQGNVTGDGTVYTIICDTVDHQNGSGYNNATGIFTAPVSGFYCFTAHMSFTNMAAGSAIDGIRIDTPSYSYYVYGASSAEGKTGTILYNGSVIAYLAAADTAAFRVAVSGGAKTVGIGNSSTHFSGSLIG